MLTTEKSKLSHRSSLYEKYKEKIMVNEEITRKLVSYQANKIEPFLRWFKYKEAFSKNLVKLLINYTKKDTGQLLDPFTGVGTTLFVGQALGWKTTGIELLTVGIFAIKARLASENVNVTEFKQIVSNLWNNVAKIQHVDNQIHHVPITKGAFPEDTEKELNKFLAYCKSISNQSIAVLLQFAAYCVLEDISYTRKDGQYLRWDHRAARDKLRSKFNKGKIVPFQEAIQLKLNQMIKDVSVKAKPKQKTNLQTFLSPSPASLPKSKNNFPLQLLEGSSLHLLPTLADKSFDLIITSPPYCNRYDYTRTYALELVFLESTDADIKQLRQTMLSCTVENKAKDKQLKALYIQNNAIENYNTVMDVYNTIDAITEINTVLSKLDDEKKLNNSGIVRMVRNYMLEMAFIIFEMNRLLKPNGYIIIVNDNVQYGGEEVPLDIIFSEIASRFGLIIDVIWMLSRGKGNSSQQMGRHGRTELRKSIYIWKKE